MPKKEATTGGQISAQAQQDLVSDGIENYELPRSLVTRIARSAVPDNTKLQKDTVFALLKGSTVFINYLAATAHDVAVSKQHKSISASDVMKGLELIGFGDLNDMLQVELNAYRELQKGDKSKKSTASTATSSKKPVSKGKGKGGLLKSPMTREPLPLHGKLASSPTTATATSAPVHMEVDEEEPAITTNVDEEREVVREEDQVEDEEEEEETTASESEEDDDVEEPEDLMEVEEDELREDAKGLDAHTESRDNDS